MTAVPQRVTAVLRGLLQVERIIAIAAFGVLVLVLFGDVLSRELSGSGLHWSAEAGVYANVFLVLAGFGMATAQGSHLRPRFADGWLPQAWEPGLQRLGFLLTAVFCACLCAYSIQLVLETLALGERSLRLGWPVALIQLVLPLAFFAGALRNSLYTVYPGLNPASEGS